MAAVLAHEIAGRRRRRDPRRGPRRRPGHARDARGHRRDRRRGPRRGGRADHRRALLRRHARLHGRPRRARGRPRRPDRGARDGDELTIDVDAGRLDVALSDEQIAERVAAYERPPRADEHVDVAIRKYAKLVGSAAEGAIALAEPRRALLGQELLEQRVERGRALEHRHVAGVLEDRPCASSGSVRANTSASRTVISRSRSPQTISVGQAISADARGRRSRGSASSACRKPGLPAPRSCSAASAAGSGSGWRDDDRERGSRRRGRRATASDFDAVQAADARDPLERGAARASRASSARCCVRGDAGGGDEHEALDALREGDRELGGDEAAHRVADDGRRVDPELLQQPVEQYARSRRSRSPRRASASAPKPGRSSAITRCSRANTGSCSSQFGHEPESPWTKTSGWPVRRSWPSSIVLTGVPSTISQRWCSRQSTSSQAPCAPTVRCGCVGGPGAAVPAAVASGAHSHECMRAWRARACGGRRRGADRRRGRRAKASAANRRRRWRAPGDRDAAATATSAACRPWRAGARAARGRICAARRGAAHAARLPRRPRAVRAMGRRAAAARRVTRSPKAVRRYVAQLSEQGAAPSTTRASSRRCGRCSPASASTA